MKYTVGINDFKVFGYHGVYPIENALGTWFYVNLNVQINVQDLQKNEYINYETLCIIIKEHFENTKAYMEDIAKQIVDTLLVKFPNCNYILNIKKENALGKNFNPFIELSNY